MTQALDTKKQTPLQELRITMESKQMREQIKMALPQHVNVDKFIRVVTTAVANEPKLLEANRGSFYNACMKAAADGLVPDGKEAALVTFGGEVAYMPMVAGILKKVRNSGELSSICAFIVHQGEKFELWVDNTGEHFKHEPNVFDKKGEAIGVYAQALTKDGGTYFEFMTKEQILAIRNVARTKNIWDGAFGLEKWKVACIRRLSKRLPMSTDLEQTIQRIDEEVDFEETPTAPPATPPAPTDNTSSRLKSAVTAKTPAPAAPPAQSAAAKATPVKAAEPNEDPNVGDGDLPI